MPKELSISYKELGDIDEAEIAGIMLHGRGALPQSVLSIGKQLEKSSQTYFIAPQAPGPNNQWYPHSFLENIEKNQPHLSNALNIVEQTLEYLKDNGFQLDEIFILGFSQGACLASEFMARNSAKYKALFALSGGLIGPINKEMDYKGELRNTEVFLGCSENDPHIPLERVNQTKAVFQKLGAKVEKVIYQGGSHNVNKDEIERISNKLK